MYAARYASSLSAESVADEGGTLAGLYSLLVLRQALEALRLLI
jgi:hypothetical protein